MRAPLPVVTSLLCIVAVLEAAAAPNLVPGRPATAANYWCTWYAQNYWQQRGGEITDFKAINNPNAREELNHDILYNEKDGWVTGYLPRGRSDYFFLIDHGWQTKEKGELMPGATPFFSLQIDPRDFPPYANELPEESLRLFNEEIKAHGWRGLGIWTRGEITEPAARRMVEWSKDADVRYWKIDGGGTRYFHSYKIKQEIFPELQLEYICGANGPLNQHWADAGRAEYPSPYAPGYSKQQPALNILRNTDTFRTYDVAPILVSTSTMRRVHDLLEQTQNKPEYIAVLNIQDDPQVAAGMGCLISSKRHPNYMERTYQGEDFHHQIRGKRMVQKRMNEIERFGRWQRIAPAFSAGEGAYLSSENDLIDSYPHTRKDTWFSACWGKLVYQSAPAIMARNMPLPEVVATGEVPYVMATTYPNGALCVATEGRVNPKDQWDEPRAKITVRVKDASQPIGVFGHYEELVLRFAGPLDGVRSVWAQDLLAEESEDILSQVTVTDDSITIPGALIDRLGTSAGDDGDISVPGLVIRLGGALLPLAGDDFVPEPRVRKPPAPTGAVAAKQTDGYVGAAKLTHTPYGYRVAAGGGSRVVVRKLSRSIDTGSATITWKMKAANDGIKRNGFLVLSADQNATASVVAGAWIGSNKMTLFENSAQWGNDLSKACKTGKELDCRLVIDMDARTAKLTVNGSDLELAFSESLTSINHIGFGVHHADTLFTDPVIRTKWNSNFKTEQ